MREAETSNDKTLDPVAEIVRAAGRREAPPQSHYDQVYAAAHEAWRNKVQSRRRNRWFAIAASLALVSGGGVLAYLIQTGDAGLAALVPHSDLVPIDCHRKTGLGQREQTTFHRFVIRPVECPVLQGPVRDHFDHGKQRVRVRLLETQ